VKHVPQTDVNVTDFEDHCWKGVMSEETLKVYEAYRRETVIKGNVTLLAVDLFASVFPSGPLPVLEAIKENPRSCGIHAWEAQPVIDRLLTIVRVANRPVIYSTDAAGHKQATNRNIGPVGTAPDPADFEIAAQFAPHPEDVIIRKQRASVFFGTNLLQELESRSTETLVLCGETTSGCVRATAVDAYSHGFHVVVIEDAVFDRSLLNHQVSLFDLHHKYADVMNLGEFERKFADRR
jgi:Isochorismate hydrolase